MSRITRCNQCGKEIDRPPKEGDEVPAYWLRVVEEQFMGIQIWHDLCSAECLARYSKEMVRWKRTGAAT